MFPFIEAQHSLLYWIFNSFPQSYQADPNHSNTHPLPQLTHTHSNTHKQRRKSKRSSFVIMKMFLILCSFLKCAALNRGGAVPIVKWNGIEWNWSRSRRGVSGGVAWVVGVKLRWQQCCARQRNKCCILCSAPGTRQSQCECRTPKTHTNRRTHTHTD